MASNANSPRIIFLKQLRSFMAIIYAACSKVSGSNFAEKPGMISDQDMEILFREFAQVHGFKYENEKLIRIHKNEDDDNVAKAEFYRFAMKAGFRFQGEKLMPVEDTVAKLAEEVTEIFDQVDWARVAHEMQVSRRAVGVEPFSIVSKKRKVTKEIANIDDPLEDSENEHDG